MIFGTLKVSAKDYVMPAPIANVLTQMDILGATVDDIRPKSLRWRIIHDGTLDP